jgi:Ca2+-transporting ATPase
MLLTGVLTAGVSFAAYGYGLQSDALELARTYAFTALVFAELLRAFGARSETRTLWRMKLSSNPSLLAAIAVPIALQIWSQHSELLSTFFKTTPISYRDGLVLLAVSAVPLFALEVIKLFRRPLVTPLGGAM